MGRRNHDGNINPIAHSLTDAYALLGTIAAIDILGYLLCVPMWSQFRHDTKLEALAWFEIFLQLQLNGLLQVMHM
ncbi:MAG: hypothetical protein CM15mP91_2050 [Chloroflexota bacterium]|nr:MAG: hypothetical protein CM15mP91_2050 [Chloroflexota bacterium]